MGMIKASKVISVLFCLIYITINRGGWGTSFLGKSKSTFDR